jgi:hypothetical protein
MTFGNVCLVGASSTAVAVDVDRWPDRQLAIVIEATLVQRVASLSPEDLALVAAKFARKDVTDIGAALCGLSAAPAFASPALESIARSGDLSVWAESGCVKVGAMHVCDAVKVRCDLDRAPPASPEACLLQILIAQAARALRIVSVPDLVMCKNDDIAARERIPEQAHGSVIALPPGHTARGTDLENSAAALARLVAGHLGFDNGDAQSTFALMVVSQGVDGHIDDWTRLTGSHEIMNTMAPELGLCGVESRDGDDSARRRRLKYEFVGHGNHYDGALVLLTDSCSDDVHNDVVSAVMATFNRHWRETLGQAGLASVMGTARVRDPRAFRTAFASLGEAQFSRLDAYTVRRLAMRSVTRELLESYQSNRQVLTALGLHECPLTRNVFDAADACEPGGVVSLTTMRSLALHFADTFLFATWGKNPFAAIPWRARKGESEPRSDLWRVAPNTPVPLCIVPHSGSIAAHEEAFGDVPVAEGHRRLYHGTRPEHVGSLIENAIDTSQLRDTEFTDFGSGFQTTPDLCVALRHAGNHGGAVLAFDVPEQRLAAITALVTYTHPWRTVVHRYSRNSPSRDGDLRREFSNPPVAEGRIALGQIELGDEDRIDFATRPSDGAPATQVVFRVGRGTDWLNENASIAMAAFGAQVIGPDLKS